MVGLENSLTHDKKNKTIKQIPDQFVGERDSI